MLPAAFGPRLLLGAQMETPPGLASCKHPGPSDEIPKEGGGAGESAYPEGGILHLLRRKCSAGDVSELIRHGRFLSAFFCSEGTRRVRLKRNVSALKNWCHLHPTSSSGRCWPSAR